MKGQLGNWTIKDLNKSKIETVYFIRKFICFSNSENHFKKILSNSKMFLFRSFLMKRLNIDISSLTPQEINQAKKVADEENLYEKIEKGRSLNRSLKAPFKPIPRTPSPNPSVPKVKPPPIPRREPPPSPRPALPNLPPPRVKPSVTSQKPNFTPRLLETVDKVQQNKPKPPTSGIPAPPPPPPPAPGPLVTPSAPSPPSPGAPKPLSNLIAPNTPVQPKRDLLSDIRLVLK